jgi:muramoyltetrapeptide carboxypeptidase
MKPIKPSKLNKGELIGLISPASSPDDLSRIEKGVSYLEKNGYKVEVGKNVGLSNGYLAGDDTQRVDDLHYMFGKKEVKAIICIRGGYGSPRLIDKIDYNLIKRHPKIFVGYSDITALQLAFLKKAGLISFAGPMLAVDFWDEVSPFTEEMFWTILTCKKKIGKINNPGNERFYVLRPGKSEGELIGGNLSLITSLLGTQYIPSFESKVLLLEEVGEAPYRIDRMLNQLRLSGILEQIKGIILGNFLNCVETDISKKTLTLNDVISDYFEKFNKPVIYNFKHGHLSDMITVVFGIRYKLNSETASIEMNESAVQ